MTAERYNGTGWPSGVRILFRRKFTLVGEWVARTKHLYCVEIQRSYNSGRLLSDSLFCVGDALAVGRTPRLQSYTLL